MGTAPSDAFLLRGGFLINADALDTKMLGLEADYAVNLCEESVVLTNTHVHTGMEMGTALANQDVAGEDILPVSTLGPETLGFAVTTVTGATDALLVREELQIDLHHRVTPPFPSF